MLRLRLKLLVALVCAGLQPWTADATELYWTDRDGGGIYRANLDSLTPEAVIPAGLAEPYRVSVDPVGGKVYWTRFNARDVQRANLDGTNIETIAVTGSPSLGLAVDVPGRSLYYGDFASVWRANLDGSAPELLVVADDIIQDIAIDGVNGKVYFSDWRGSSRGKLRRMNLDGTEPEDLFTAISRGPVGVAVDPLHETVYWARASGDPTIGGIQRGNLDGTGRTTIIDGIAVDSLALDSTQNKLYWSYLNFVDPFPIRRANLDGSGVEELPFGTLMVGGVSIIPEPQSVTLVLLALAGMRWRGRSRAP